jgi:putative Ca2+/H+ antiporter (TMEM165/GDT1 family)
MRASGVARLRYAAGPSFHRGLPVLHAFSISTLLVALAEMGDKTQLLAFVLAARLKRRGEVVAGILVATVINHALAGWAGTELGGLLSPQALRWTVALAFFAFAVWALMPDRLQVEDHPSRHGAFMTAAIAFFFAEMGDKTQLATVALAARYEQVAAVVVGTTLGMMIANVPAVWLGERLAQRVDMRWMRRAAAALFAALGVAVLAV